MHQSWISTESALPADGQPVQFVLYRRSLPIAGVFTHDGFRSRWTRYAREVVCKWRGLLDGEIAPALPFDGDDHTFIAAPAREPATH